MPLTTLAVSKNKTPEGAMDPLVGRELTPDRQHGPRQSSAGDGVPWVFLLADVHHAAVDGWEKAAPNGKVTCKRNPKVGWW